MSIAFTNTRDVAMHIHNEAIKHQEPRADDK